MTTLSDATAWKHEIEESYKLSSISYFKEAPQSYDYDENYTALWSAIL